MLYNHNGKLCEAVEIEMNNRSFLYGDGIFERLLVFNGKIFNRENHKKRINFSLSELDLDLQITTEQLLESIEELVEVNKLAISCCVRLTIYRNSGGMYTPLTNSASFLIESSAKNEQSFVMSDGLKLGLYDKHKKSSSALSTIKSTSAILYVLASLKKRESKEDELLLLNDFNRPIEATNSNVFIVKQDKLITPPLSEGALAGSMRALIIDNFEVEELALEMDDFKGAEEIFLTNCNGLRWVCQFEEKTDFTNSKTKEIVEFLNGLI